MFNPIPFFLSPHSEIYASLLIDEFPDSTDDQHNTLEVFYDFVSKEQKVGQKEYIVTIQIQHIASHLKVLLDLACPSILDFEPVVYSLFVHGVIKLASYD